LEAAIRLYLDENLSPKVTEQLKLRGSDAVCARDLRKLGDSDENHLARATKLGRDLVTSDVDFLRLASEGIDHAGIIFGVQSDHALGDWVKKLELLCFIYSSTEFENHVEYL
jgi:hypothetical protein